MQHFRKRNRAGRVGRLSIGVAVALVAATAPAVADGEVAQGDTSIWEQFLCNGGFDDGTVHDLDWTLKGVPSTFYVNEAPKTVSALVDYRLPASESDRMRWAALGLGTFQGWLTPTVDLNGTAVAGIEMTSPRKDMSYGLGGRFSLPFDGPMFTLPTQTTPGTIQVRVPSYQMPVKDWNATGLESPSRNPNYVCGVRITEDQPVTPVLATYVVKSHSSVGLEITPSSGVYAGTSAKAVATVGVDGGTVDGVVRFQLDGRTLEAPTNGLGQAEIQFPADLPAGNVPVVATYVPNDTTHYDQSSTNGMVKVKAQASTSTSVSMPSLRLAPGEAGEATVLVTAGEGSPEGSVSLQVAGQAPQSAVIEAGSASFTLPPLAMGRHSVQAVFTPVQGQHAGSTSATTTITQLGTSSVVLEDPAPVASNANGTLQARVSADGGDTSGVVTFRVGGNAIEANVVNGVATTNAVPRLAPGAYPVQAEFRPGPGVDVLSSTSDGKDLVVTPVATEPQPTDDPNPTPVTPVVPAPTVSNPAASNVRVALSRGSVVYGTRPTVTAAVGRTAAGSVTFTVAGTTSTVKVVDGVATLQLGALGAGRHAVTAAFTPADASAWAASTAATQLTVTRDTAAAKVKVKVNKKKKVKAVVTVAAANGGVVNGTAKVVLSGKGLKKQKLTVQVRNGRAVAKFRKAVLSPTFKVAAKFRATPDVAGTKAVALVKPKARTKAGAGSTTRYAAAGRVATTRGGLL